MTLRKVVAFGGTFDPVHLGHLYSALELRDRLRLDQIRLIPCHQPPHRDSPDGSSRHRLAMVELAVAEHSALVADAIELERDSPSYTVETLRVLRRRLGDDISLSILIGADAFNLLHTWREWRSLFELANVIVMRRAEVELAVSEEVATWAASREVTEAQWSEQRAGGLLHVSLKPWPISATQVRELIGAGGQAEDLLPVPVWRYIQEQHLYGYAHS